MSENLLMAFQITLIGMALVFGVIIVLWIVMSLLVRITAQREEPIEETAAPRFQARLDHFPDRRDAGCGHHCAGRRAADQHVDAGQFAP